MSATPTWPAAALPGEITPLLGRDREAGQVRGLLDDPAIRLVTIIGPGGVGKTRLALDVAQGALADDRDVAFVPLSAITDPQLVLPAILRALGVYRESDDAPVDRLADLLGDRSVLLVLDNFEQVRGAAVDLAAVLGHCRGLTVLVTSQAPLGISGEQLFPLAPMPLPPAGATRLADIEASDAVRLFAARARAANPAFDLDERTAATVADICRRLDGLPLAIELAAARVRLLSPEALLARLSNRLRVLGGERRDVPDRLRTMRHAIAWSYDLLAPDEQRLFRQLAVFVDGATLEAVEAIAQPSDRTAFDVLGALVDHSLVQPAPQPSGEMRFVLLGAIRDYGLEQLDAGDETEVAHLAHAGFFVALAEAAMPAMTGRGQQAWLERLEPEAANFRAAATWALDHGQPELALRIGGAAWRFFGMRGLARDCVDWLRRALSADQSRTSPWRVRGLIGLGNLYEDVRDLDTAHSHFLEARELAAAAGDLSGEAQAIIGLATLAHDAGRYDEALQIHTEATGLARASGDRHALARSLGNLGAVSYYLGRLDDAERYWEEARQLMASLGDIANEATSTGNLGALAYERGDLARSEALHQQALALQRHIRSTRDIPYSLINIAGVATLQGHYQLARESLGEAIALLRETGNTAVEGVALNVAAGLALAEGKPAEAASHLIDSVRLVSDAGDQRAVIEDAELLAETCVASGNFAAAAELLAAADRGRRDLGTEATPQKVAELARIAEAIGGVIDIDAEVAARAAGGRLALDALPRRITTIAREIVGERHQPVTIAARVVPAPVDYGLTARELEVLRLLTEGRTTEQISDLLYISPRTATTHLTHIMGKLAVPSRTAAVALALREGIA
jgi:predicted ATPase/DNA-binding CsgD family transcriptional regulator/Tfp pilus assembly protein PilF